MRSPTVHAGIQPSFRCSGADSREAPYGARDISNWNFDRKEDMANKRGLTCLAIAALALGLMAGACGEDDTQSGEGSTSSESASGNGVDRAFASAMIPHHRSAVEMAEIAKERSKRSEIKQLADAIVRTQNAEIEQLTALDQHLKDAGVEPGDLGVAEHEMGMDGDASMLEDAKPFDREFIDMMIPHHQGAIRMARVELAEGENRELKALAEAIVDAQTKEIDEMNTWRVEWFGGISPAGGVPAEEDSGGGHSGGHGM
jgi:uncharacterized protein (DUF305 family)